VAPRVIAAFVNSNLAAVPLVPVVAVAPVSVARWTHPLTVIVFPLALSAVPGVCVASPAVAAQIVAAHVNQNVFRMLPSREVSGAGAWCNPFANPHEPRAGKNTA
jgi:hypothetical protein